MPCSSVILEHLLEKSYFILVHTKEKAASYRPADDSDNRPQQESDNHGQEVACSTGWFQSYE